MAEIEVKRAFATIDGRWGTRQVHYRYCGSGPMLLLLHQSPQSSVEYVPLMKEWGAHFTIVAPDTPGYGISDSLGDMDAPMEDFADAVAEFLDEIGVGKVAVYGFHTGAGMAASVGVRHPDKVTCVAANGYVVIDDDEREDLLTHYLPAFEPKWDGSHLAWLWARMREQLIFFPWYRRAAEARMSLNVPPPERLQEGVLNFLRAGDDYRGAYGAAFAFRGEVAAAELAVPTLITAADQDPLAEHLTRMPDASRHVTIKAGGSANATIDLALDFLRQHPGSDETGTRSTRPIAGKLHNEMLDVPGGQLRMQRNGDADGMPVIVLHDAAGSSVTASPAAGSFVGLRPVVALDLPGHGESDALIDEANVTVGQYSTRLADALDALGYERVDLYGQWGGGLVALDLAIQQPARVSHVVISGVMHFDDDERQDLLANYAPEIKPDWYGGHLLQCWHLMRAQALFWPWYRAEAVAALPGEPFVDPDLIHRRVVEMLKSPRMWYRAYRAHFSYDTKRAFEAVTVPTGVGAVEWDANLPHTKRAAEEFSKLSWVELPISSANWGEAIVQWMDES